MKLSLLRLTTLLLCLSLLVACAARSPTDLETYVIEFQHEDRRARSAEVDRQSSIFLDYVKAEYLRSMDNETRSLQLLRSAADKAQGEDERHLRTRLAQLYLGSGQLEPALEQIELALKLSPTDAQILLMKADVFEAQRRFAEARSIYRALIEREHEIETVRLLHANVDILEGNRAAAEDALVTMREDYPENELVVFLLAQVYEEQGRVDSAIELLNEFRVENPDNPRAITEGIKLALRYRSQNMDEIEDLSRALLKADSSSILARRLLSEIAMRKRDFSEALEHLYILEDVQSERSDVRLKIALISLDQGKLGEAEKQLQLLLAANPEDDRALFYLASLKTEQGLHSEAQELLSAIPKASSFYARSQVLASVLHVRAGNAASAINSLQEAREAGMRSSAVTLQLATLLAQEQRLDEAITVFEDLLADDSSSTAVLFRYASLLYDATRYDEALAVLDQLLAADERSADILNLYAYILALKGERLDEALVLVNEALESRPNDAYFLDTRGWIYFTMDRLEEALADLQSATALAPNDLIISGHYVKVLFRKGQVDTARAFYQKIVREAQQREELRAEERKLIQELSTLFRR